MDMVTEISLEKMEAKTPPDFTKLKSKSDLSIE